MEACRIGIKYKGIGFNHAQVVDVGAPMKHKELCYDMLRDAKAVIAATPEHIFQLGVVDIAIVMDMTGRVDVSAPLPPRRLANLWLESARDLIERYNDDSEPQMRAFSEAVMAGGSCAD